MGTCWAGRESVWKGARVPPTGDGGTPPTFCGSSVSPGVERVPGGSGSRWPGNQEKQGHWPWCSLTLVTSGAWECWGGAPLHPSNQEVDAKWEVDGERSQKIRRTVSQRGWQLFLLSVNRERISQENINMARESLAAPLKPVGSCKL